MDSKIVIDVSTGPAAPNGSFEVSFKGCGSCCWTVANGSATPSAAGGGVIHVVARGATCDTDRLCVGTVSGSTSRTRADGERVATSLQGGAEGVNLAVSRSRISATDTKRQHAEVSAPGRHRDVVSSRTDNPSSSSSSLNSDADAEPFAAIEISWACTCHTPPVSCGAFGETPWVKQ